MNTRVAVIQSPPVLLDLQASLEHAITEVDRAAANGAELLVFPEAYLPGYPTWAWRLRPGTDMTLSDELHARLRANAVDLDRDDLRPLREAVKRNAVTVVMGLHERDGRYSGTTLFNSVATIGPDGRLLNRHRKLMPTNPERMIWGLGDASGLRVVETPAGRLGSLICWECYLPLARFALYAQGMDIFVNPTWDAGETRQATLCHIAREGGCWVIGTATALQGGDIPEAFPGRAQLFAEDEWINPGDATVVAPGGKVVAGPLHREKGILYAEVDVEAARRARRTLDVGGHYGRPDLFTLSVDREPKPPVRFS